ncbi:MAG TPA: hypothetical protein VFS97_01795 [Nitrososphaeraceae archaeon]|nr:hypothetical protein [Nitrososphaeraceae archaeon]
MKSGGWKVFKWLLSGQKGEAFTLKLVCDDIDRISGTIPYAI